MSKLRELTTLLQAHGCWTDEIGQARSGWAWTAAVGGVGGGEFGVGMAGECRLSSVEGLPGVRR
jgi:hypothetical protein